MRVRTDEDAEIDPKGEIHIIWCVDDIISIAPWVSPEQARDVLATIEHDNDCTIGVTWDTLDFYVDMMYPKPKDWVDEEED